VQALVSHQAQRECHALRKTQPVSMRCGGGIDAGRLNYELRDVGILLAPGAGMRSENLMETRMKMSSVGIGNRNNAVW